MNVTASVCKYLKVTLNKHEYLSGVAAYIEKLYRHIMHTWNMKATDNFIINAVNTLWKTSINHDAHRILLEWNMGGTVIWNSMPMRHRTG